MNHYYKVNKRLEQYLPIKIKEKLNEENSNNLKSLFYEKKNFIDDFDENAAQERIKKLDNFFVWKIKEWVKVWKM